MKILIFSIVLCLVIPSINVASYVIKLKNGRKISAQYYWKENGKIFFHIYGGVVGIRKDQVKEIEEIEDLPDEKAAAKQEAPETTEKAEEEKKLKNQGESEKGSEEEKGKETFLKEKSRIATEIEAVSAAFREAKAKNDRKQMQVKRKRLLSLQTELSKLREKARADHGGQVPAWWDKPLP